jgi:hypothetical protein
VLLQKGQVLQLVSVERTADDDFLGSDQNDFLAEQKLLGNN